MEVRDPALAETDPRLARGRVFRWRKFILWVFAGIFIGLIFAASWAPESQMAKLGWVPDWVGVLADRDPNIRTAVPFVPLAFLLFRGFKGSSFRRPLLGSLTVGGACLGLSEFGQIFLPLRTADVRDLLWGLVGMMIGSGIGWISCYLRRTASAAP